MDQAQKLIEQFRSKVRDYCDNPSAPEVSRLDGMLNKMLGDVKRNADNSALVHQSEELENFLENLRRTEGIYDADHINDMYHRQQELERLFRNMP